MPRRTARWTGDVEALLGRCVDAAYAYRFGPPAHDPVVATLRDADGELLAQAAHFPARAAAGDVALRADRRGRDGDAVLLDAPTASRGASGSRRDGVVRRATTRSSLRPGRRAAGARGGRRGDARAGVTALNLIGETPVSGPDVAA